MKLIRQLSRQPGDGLLWQCTAQLCFAWLGGGSQNKREWLTIAGTIPCRMSQTAQQLDASQL